MALVSVVTPTYEHASFIGDCIRSVLAQTMQDWEMVVVDDGSTDGTADIAESFRDPRVIVLRRPHGGVAGLGRTYSEAVACTSGPLVAVLEGDDTWEPTKLERQLPAFRDPDVVLAYGAAGLMDETGCVYATYTHSPRGRVAINDPVGTIIPALMRLNFIVAATVVVRRSALAEIGGFYQPDGISYVDHPTWLRLAALGPFARSADVLANWRRYPRQVTTRGWFDVVPDRSPYLRLVAAEARQLVTPDVNAAIEIAIDADRRQQDESALIGRARLALLDGRWEQAARIFRKLMRVGEPRTKAVAAIGLACAGARTDMERLISARGRHSMPSRRHMASHQPPVPSDARQEESQVR